MTRNQHRSPASTTIATALLAALALALAAGCSDSETFKRDSSTVTDGSPTDGALGALDKGARDAPSVDGPALDSRVGDARLVDSAPRDSALPDAAPAPFRVLVFTRTRGFRHGSIGDGVNAVKAIAIRRGWLDDHTEDPTRFTAANLARYRVVIWLSTTGDVLDATQQTAFEGFIKAGGGYVGVHSATDTEYGWPWYGKLVGAYFKRHPQIQAATLAVENTTHPATAHLSATWKRTDEWYDFRANPRANVTVLLTIDEKSYSGGTMGADHPVAWAHTFDGGRAFYTALGHTNATYKEADFIAHLEGGIAWAGGLKK